MPPPPACLGECTNLHLVDALTARGYDVTSLHIVGPRGLSDRAVLMRTTDLGRVLITHNTRDFRKLDAEFRHKGQRHCGIICLPQPRHGTFDRLVLRAAMMLDWIGTQRYEAALFQWGQLQRLLEEGLRLPGYDLPEIEDALCREPIT
jgi:hypothetical protein